MLAGKQCCFGEPEHWTQMEPGGRVRGGWGAKLDTSVIRSELKGEKREQGEKRRERRRQRVWCKVLSCIGKMTLAKLKGFLLLKPSALQPPSVPLPSPNCVFRPVMKHSDRASAQGLTFSQCTWMKKSGFCNGACIFSQLPMRFFFCLQATEHSVRACFIDSGKVQLRQVGLVSVTCRRKSEVVYSL